jgi:hypothetical protein
MRVIKEMGKEMREELKYKEIMLEGPQILGWTISETRRSPPR